MPTIRAASTPSRSVIMNACNMSGTPADHFENEFQFQLYRIVFRRWERQRNKSQLVVICITRGVERVEPGILAVRVAAETAWQAPARGTAFPRPGTRVSARSVGCPVI